MVDELNHCEGRAYFVHQGSSGKFRGREGSGFFWQSCSRYGFESGSKAIHFKTVPVSESRGTCNHLILFLQNRQRLNHTLSG